MGSFNVKSKNIRPVLQSKKNPKVTDPIRYPAVIEPLENQAKREYADILELTLQELSKEMIKIKKR